MGYAALYFLKNWYSEDKQNAISPKSNTSLVIPLGDTPSPLLLYANVKHAREEILYMQPNLDREHEICTEYVIICA